LEAANLVLGESIEGNFSLSNLLQKRCGLFARKHAADHPLRHLFWRSWRPARVAFLKFAPHTGKQRSHASREDGARWLDDDGKAAAAFEDKPKKVHDKRDWRLRNMQKTGNPIADRRCSGCLPDWGNPPSLEQYTKLMNSLFTVKVGVRNQIFDPLNAAFQAVQSVVLFLNSNPTCRKFGLTRELAILVWALNDASQGAKPPLFFNRAKIGFGPPTRLAESILRSEVILMFRMLRNSGISELEASRWLAAELKESGVMHKKTMRQPDGQQINPRQIVRWSSEVGGQSLSGSDEAYLRLEGDELRRHDWPTQPNQARRRVRSLLHSLVDMGF
jgi:hypothetical protein